MVSFLEGENLSKEFKIKFFETSAFENQNVEDCFLSIASDVVGRVNGTSTASSGASAAVKSKAEVDEGNLTVSKTGGKKAAGSGCC